MYTSDMTMIFDILVESLFKVTLNHILINRKVFFGKSKPDVVYTSFANQTATTLNLEEGQCRICAYSQFVGKGGTTLGIFKQKIYCADKNFINKFALILTNGEKSLNTLYQKTLFG